MSEFILGNEKVRNHLKESILKKTVSHAYILAGDKGIGKQKIAREFAMRLICERDNIGCGHCPACRQFLANSYPDFFYMDSENKESIGIDKRCSTECSFKDYRGTAGICCYFAFSKKYEPAS